MIRKHPVSGPHWDAQFLVTCPAPEKPWEGGDHLCCPVKEIVVSFFPFFSFFFSFMGKGDFCLNRVFVALHFRESQKMFYVNDYKP